MPGTESWHMRIGLQDLDQTIAERIREKLESLRMMGFEDHHHPHTAERDARLAARAVLLGRDKVPLVARWAISGVLGLGGLILVAGGINAGTIPGPMVIAGPALGGASYWFSWWVNKQGRVDDLELSM